MGSQAQKTHIREDGSWELSELSEEDYEGLAVYLVPDLPTEPNETNKAEASLPRNLCFKPSAVLPEVMLPDVK